MERFKVKVEECREDLGNDANGNESAHSSTHAEELCRISGENLKTPNLSPPLIPIQGIKNDAQAMVRIDLQSVEVPRPSQQTEKLRQGKRRRDPPSSKSSESGNYEGPMKKKSLRGEMKQWKSIADQAKPPIQWKQEAAKRNVTGGEPLNNGTLCAEPVKPGVLNVAPASIPGTRRVVNAKRRPSPRPQPPRKPVVPGAFEKISLYLARAGEKRRGCNYAKLLNLEAKNHLRVRTPTGCISKSNATSTNTIDKAKPAESEAEGAQGSIPIESVSSAIDASPVVQVKLETLDNPEWTDSYEEV